MIGEIKSVMEVVGCTMTLLAMFLMGRPGKAQQVGCWISIAGGLPWTVFSIVTTSWFMLAQTWVIVAVGIYNLYLHRRKINVPA